MRTSNTSRRSPPSSSSSNEDGGLKDLALSTHGVNNGQAVKTGPVWSLVSGSRHGPRRRAAQMIAELDKYHGLPNGMFSCDEHLAGRDPSQGSELCTVVEYMFSLEHALAITGDAALGDRLERLAFNALPGTLTDDMWAHQYNQEPNQVECSLHHKPWVSDGPESNLFGLEPNFGCCTANYHQGWPKFAASLFLMCGASRRMTAHDGLVAAAYAPCEVRTTSAWNSRSISLRKPTIRFAATFKSRSARPPRWNSHFSCGFPRGLREPPSLSTAVVNRSQPQVRSRGFSVHGNPAIASKSHFRCSRAFHAGSMTRLRLNAVRSSSPTGLEKTG